MRRSFDWRRKLSEYDDACCFERRSRTIVQELEARLRCSTSPEEQEALAAGLALANRRVGLEQRRLAEITWMLTEGRSLVEAMWSVPDDD